VYRKLFSQGLSSVRRLLHRADGKACDEPVDKEIIDDCDRHARDQANGCRTRCARGSRVGPSKTCLHQVILRETHAEQSVFRLTPEGGPPICASMLKTMRDPAQRRRDPVLDFRELRWDNPTRRVGCSAPTAPSAVGFLPAVLIDDVLSCSCPPF
jgi:hypothetical protein